MKVIVKYDDDKQVIEVASCQELVERLNDTAIFRSESTRQYMFDYARRAVIARNIDIRATDYESFVEDLVKAGDIELTC
ncbi:hypothetical protein [Chitinophaga sp. OAE865]|uniref:hypothetical protein n=1 Tax=Chitinophaga sp. OAE865 TaxID=2817898 RepID=UPI001AE878CD